jgi:large conductance mechanosensitive channel
MPLIGSFIGKSFESLTAEVNGVHIQYGAFIQAIINFLLIALFLFLLIKGIIAMKKEKDEAPSFAGPSPTEKLLTEIRDLLKK